MKKYILGILIALMACLMMGCDTEPMTEEERAAYEASRTYVYDVVSVNQYLKTTQTNYFGAPISQEIRYYFTYIDENGNLCEFEDFEHTEYGLWKICVGDENKYIVKDGIDTYRWLYLTADTLKNMEMQ